MVAVFTLPFFNFFSQNFVAYVRKVDTRQLQLISTLPAAKISYLNSLNISICILNDFAYWLANGKIMHYRTGGRSKNLRG